MAGCLALWSLGMIVARSCSLTRVAWALAPVLNEKFYALRERLRDWYREVPAKAGRKALRTRSGHLLGTVALLGGGWLARPTTGAGLGCDDSWTAFHGAGA